MKEVIFVELGREEAQKIVDKYGKEAKDALSANKRASAASRDSRDGGDSKRFRPDNRDSGRRYGRKEDGRNSSLQRERELTIFDPSKPGSSSFFTFVWKLVLTNM